jgi:hypothetical protein
MNFIPWDSTNVGIYYRFIISPSCLFPPGEIERWCRENCTGNIMIPVQAIHWFFELESDAMAFKLRWM